MEGHEQSEQKTGEDAMVGSASSLPPRSAKLKARKKKRSRLKWAVIVLLGLLLSAAGGYLHITWLQVLKTIDNIAGETNADVPDDELASKRPLAILLLGLDSRPATGSLNTDVIMVAGLNPERKSAVVVSVPRDAYMEVSGWNGRKANSFYPALYNRNRQTVLEDIRPIFGEFLGVPIDYTAVVNFEAFREMVDELGGIHVNVDQDMYYVDPTDGTHIDLKKGPQTLNGKQALDFVRYRHSNRGETPDSSDFARNRRQQQVIAAIVDKLKSFNVIFKVNGILEAAGKNINTNIPREQLLSLIRTYAFISNENIQYITLEGQWKSPFVHLHEQQLENARQALREQLSLGQESDRQEEM